MAERPTWSCGHPVSPDPTTEEAWLHVGHASQAYLDDQYARNAEIALLGEDAAMAACQRLSHLRWAITQVHCG